MKEKYHIYNYLKNHEGALIALVSGITGFLVMTLNFVLYIADRFYLSVWNCNLIPIENSPSRFYSICIWVVFFVISLFMGRILGKASIRFQNEAAELNLFLQELKENKKELKICEKLFKRQKKQMEEENKALETKKMKDVKHKISSAKRKISKMRNQLQLKTTVNILILSAECSIPITIIKYIQTLDFLQSLKSTIISIGILLLLLIPLCLIALNLFSRKKSIESKNTEHLSEYYFSDSAIFQNCRSAAWIFLFVVTQILFNSVVENLSKKQFEIFRIDNQEYASIYESENYLIGEKISSEDSTITIYLDSQIVVEKTNLSLVKKKFKKVTKVDAFQPSLQSLNKNNPPHKKAVSSSFEDGQTIQEKN